MHVGKATQHRLGQDDFLLGNCPFDLQTQDTLKDYTGCSKLKTSTLQKSQLQALARPSIGNTRLHMCECVVSSLCHVSSREVGMGDSRDSVLSQPNSFVSLRPMRDPACLETQGGLHWRNDAGVELHTLRYTIGWGTGVGGEGTKGGNNFNWEEKKRNFCFILV